MTAPSISLSEQMLRRRPVIGAPVAHGAADHLHRTIGTFQLTMFGVGATVGTGIFFVLSVAVPEAGTAVIISFIIAGVAAGLVEWVVALTARRDVAMRVISFAIRGRTKFPPEVVLHAEDSLLEAWAAQLREMLAKLKTDGSVGEDVALQVVTGNGWDEALDAADWEDGVFLGSHSAKIIRHSPVRCWCCPAEQATSTSVSVSAGKNWAKALSWLGFAVSTQPSRKGLCGEENIA